MGVNNGLQLLKSGRDAEGHDSSWGGPLERRHTKRFPMRESLTYSFRKGKLACAGSGKTIDISSKGILFEADEALQVGGVVQVAVNWPVLLDGTCFLKFVVEGRVMRAEQNRMAV